MGAEVDHPSGRRVYASIAARAQGFVEESEGSTEEKKCCDPDESVEQSFFRSCLSEDAPQIGAGKPIPQGLKPIFPTLKCRG